MAGETDFQTITGILKARTKIEEVMAFLRNMDPENETVVTNVRQSRGLCKALEVALWDLDTICNELRNAKRPSAQTSIDDLLRAARKDQPQMEGVDTDLITEAAKSSDTDPAPAPPKAESKPKKKPKKKAAKPKEPEKAEGMGGDDTAEPDEAEPEPEVDALGDRDSDEGDPPEPEPEVEDDAPPANVPAADALALLSEAQPERDWSVGSVLPMTQEERAEVVVWHKRGLEGEMPACVERNILEDLDPLESGDDLETLFSWVDIMLGGSQEDWSDDFTDEAIAWAAAAHRNDRGESVVMPPDMPSLFVPNEEIFAQVLAFVHAEGEVSPLLVQNEFHEAEIGVFYAFQALVNGRLIERSESGSGLYVAKFPELLEEWDYEEPLLRIVINLGARRNPLDHVVFPDTLPSESE